MKRSVKSSKLFSLALALCLVLTLMLTCFFSVSAAEEDPEIVWGASADALTGGGTLYQASIAAYDGTASYFRLQKDITLDSAMEPWILENVITIDLGGHTLSMTNGFGIIGGGLILEDSAGGGELIASDGAAIFVSTFGTEFSTVTVKGGTLKGKQAINVYSPCEFRLEGGTLSGSQYGDVYISSEDAKVIVTGSTFTSSVAAFAYGKGGVIDLSNATGDDYSINVTGTMMVSEMATDKVILPEGFSLLDDGGEKITAATVAAGKVITAKQDAPAVGPNTGNTGNGDSTGNGGSEGNPPANNTPGNAGNEGSADKNNSGTIVIIIVIVIVVLLAGAGIFFLVLKKRKKEEPQEEPQDENQ